MNHQLLDVLKYIEKHPHEGIDRSFSQPGLEKAYLDFIEYRCQKNRVCPICGEAKPLTKHHIIPRGKGGKGLLSNFFYLCRECHDEIHGMNSRDRIIQFLEDNPHLDIDDVVEELGVSHTKIIEVKYPDYWVRCKIKYETRIIKKVSTALKNLF